MSKKNLPEQYSSDTDTDVIIRGAIRVVGAMALASATSPLDLLCGRSREDAKYFLDWYRDFVVKNDIETQKTIDAKNAALAKLTPEELEALGVKNVVTKTEYPDGRVEYGKR